MLTRSFYAPLTLVLIFFCTLSSYGQTGTSNDFQHDECNFSVEEFHRTAYTSPQLIHLQSQLIDPSVSVSINLLVNLSRESMRDAGFSILQPGMKPAGDAASSYAKNESRFLAKYSDVLIRVLLSKQEPAQSESLLTAAENPYYLSLPLSPEIRNCLRNDVANIFPSLPFETQWNILLSENYPLFKSQSLANDLQQLYASVEDRIRDSQIGAENDERTLRFYKNKILRRMYEADPDSGRAIIFKEIASPRPQVDIEALRILPEETLPEFDALFVEQMPDIYENANEYEFAAKIGIIERYATIKLLPAMKSIYANQQCQWSEDQEATFLSYFLRVDPVFGRHLIEQHLKNHSVQLTDMYGIRPSSPLNSIAAEHLHDDDRQIAAGAAAYFRRTGNKGVQSVLWKYLKEWRQRWGNSAEAIPFEEQNYQDSLAEALLFGSGPCPTRDTVERLKHLYIKGHSVDGNIRFADWTATITLSVSRRYPEIEFRTSQCNGEMTLGEFEKAVPNFTEGTEFEIYRILDSSLDPELDQAVKDISTFLKNYGMALRVK